MLYSPLLSRIQSDKFYGGALGYLPNEKAQREEK